jgi:hypothetical protein
MNKRAAMRERSLEVDARISALTADGLTSRQVAQRLGLGLPMVRSRISRLRKKGAIPKLLVCRYGQEYATLKEREARTPGNIGSIRQFVRCLTRGEMERLVKMVPKGLTVAEFAAAVMKDLIAEEME